MFMHDLTILVTIFSTLLLSSRVLINIKSQGYSFFPKKNHTNQTILFLNFLVKDIDIIFHAFGSKYHYDATDTYFTITLHEYLSK